MKKTTKETNPLTPAKKPAKTVRKTAKTTPPAAPAVKETPPAPPAAKVAPTVVVTTISASYDVGFGNTLYLRGEGPGLSWEKGLRMDCVGDTTWTIALGESARPYLFKFLINDEVWNAGDNYSATSGTTITLIPAF